MPFGRTSACRYMIKPVLVHRSKWPTQSCSLIAAIKRCGLRHAVLPNLHVGCAGQMQRSISAIHVNDNS